jgi:hypothetical protein
MTLRKCYRVELIAVPPTSEYADKLPVFCNWDNDRWALDTREEAEEVLQDLAGWHQDCRYRIVTFLEMPDDAT